jgi:hypothetical protein
MTLSYNSMDNVKWSSDLRIHNFKVFLHMFYGPKESSVLL